MAYHHGNEGIVKVASNTIAEVQEWTYNEADVAVLEKTSMGDTEAGYKAAGCKRGGGSINCLLDETDTNGQNAMTAGASVTLNLYPEGAGTGAIYWSGTAIIESVEIIGNKAGFEERNFTFKGVLTSGTVA